MRDIKSTRIPHENVEQDDIWLQLLRQHHRCISSRGLPYHLKIFLFAQHSAEAFTDYLVVIHDQDSYHRLLCLPFHVLPCSSVWPYSSLLFNDALISPSCL